MRTYEHPASYETFKASSPAHAAARIHGGSPANYTVVHKTRMSRLVGGVDIEWNEIYNSATHEFVGDLYYAD